MHARDSTGFGYYPLCAHVQIILAVPLSARLVVLGNSHFVYLPQAFSTRFRIIADEYCSEARVYKSMPTWILLHRLCSD